MLTDEDGEPVAFNVTVKSSGVKHYSTYPPNLVRPMLQATGAARSCAVCGAPFTRQVELTKGSPASFKGSRFDDGATAAVHPDIGTKERTTGITTTGLVRSCGHTGGDVPSIVLDPFCGSGTTGVVATRLGMRFIGLELSDEYVESAVRNVEGSLARRN